MAKKESKILRSCVACTEGSQNTCLKVAICSKRKRNKSEKRNKSTHVSPVGKYLKTSIVIRVNSFAADGMFGSRGGLLMNYINK